MDTRTTAIDVNAQISEIRDFMPETYQSIQAKAAEIGNTAFALVRRGLRGEPNCFYAVERGKVVGTPFTNLQGAGELADMVRKFGCAYVCIFQAPASGGANGAH